MGNKANNQLISTVRSIVGSDRSEMEIIRALHMAKYDATAAINIILDSPPPLKLKEESPNSITRKPSPVKVSVSDRPIKKENVENDGDDGTGDYGKYICTARFIGDGKCIGSARSEIPSKAEKLEDDYSLSMKTEKVDNGCSSVGSSELNIAKKTRLGGDWWLVECCDVAGFSTSKGRKVKQGDEVTFTFPVKGAAGSSKASLANKGFGRGRQAAAACSEIVRFSTKDAGEIGRIPNEWGRCLLPLVKDNKVKIEGWCKSVPDVLGIMSTIHLSVRVYINSSMFHKHHQASLKAASDATEESTVHPLPSLFRLLGLTPFKRAEFTPDDLCTRKRPLESKDVSGLPAPLFPVNKLKNQSQSGSEDPISDSDLENIVGVGHNSELEEMDPPSTLQCELRPYQKQALHWMFQLEKRHSMDEAEPTLHPCWEAYRLADERDLVVYLNAFTGDASIEFPSTMQLARGGILADAMGLGKTVMTIALLLTQSKRGGLPDSQSTHVPPNGNEANCLSDQSPSIPERTTKISGLNKFLRQKNELLDGGNLIICPMTLLGQWKEEIETHVQPESLSLCVHYGQERLKDAKNLAQYDVVITTYGVLASEFSAENSEGNSGLYSIRWLRVVLDEAHTIKSSKSQLSRAATALVADCRWCLTGTPIQNNLEDIYSLLRFLRVEPWGNWAWWYKLIQKPFEGGDERGLRLVQSILKPIMLRRTKSSTDRGGRPILVLPPVDSQVIYCELSEFEKDFYEALFKKSKVKFDKFVEQGRVLHNYASILELLLRLRQCCDHPFLVMSRGDTQEYSDLNKLARRFLKGRPNGNEEEANDAPSRAYVQQVVEELSKGQEGECPICLEAFEDAVFTPCAHRLCRECLLATWRNATSGLCPVCRKTISKQDLITAPTESRFHVDVQKNWVESSKVTVLMRELESLRSSGSKSILFSQWTAFLDLLQIPLSRNNIPFLRLDGTLSQKQRENVIRQFSEDSNILVLLMSLKAGGVGINLTAASNAFVLDPWWNPAVEEQAVMRIHRIGQTNRVTIKRFIVKGSVEERMEAVQARKQRMIAGALTDQEVRTARIEELKMLFT
ncbi:hypothetical protein SLE2022_355120 [Rubroshorea leprosula]